MPEIRNISFSYREYHKSEGSDIPYINLIEEAKKAAENAYAPYSGFRVGAAIMLESGRIIRGSNVENAAFPSGTCAETAALSYSVSNYPGDTPIAIAIAAMKGNSFTSVPVAPCGNCRQMIIEEEFRNKKKI
jgi:cytidine deaminase